MLDTYLEVLELGFFEVTEAFRDLPDENVWKRPAPGLLSIGELAGHIAFWEAARMTGEAGGDKPDPTTFKVTSPLLDQRFYYYSKTLDTTPSEEHLAMTAAQVCEELLRVHKESVAVLREKNPDLKSEVPFWHFSLEEYLKYASFHVAYHTGQMYSVRHLLGETTPDN